MTSPRRPTGLDPATLAVGALIVMAFHRTKPLNDNIFGKLLGQLFGVFGGKPDG